MRLRISIPDQQLELLDDADGVLRRYPGFHCRQRPR